jgi:uncharacterized protein YutE (UPF0331/DUF86 family)
MTVDEVQSKLDVIRDNLERMQQIPQASYAEFSADFRNLDSALHRLQTTIQALIDLAGFVVARRALNLPTSSRSVLQGLEAAGALPPGTSNRYAPILGFRNRIVHLYDRVDPQIVFRILREERADLEDLLRLLLAALDE